MINSVLSMTVGDHTSPRRLTSESSVNIGLAGKHKHAVSGETFPFVAREMESETVSELSMNRPQDTCDVTPIARLPSPPRHFTSNVGGYDMQPLEPLQP